MEILWRRGSLPQNFTEIHAKKGKPLAMAHKHSCEEGEASRNGKRFFFTWLECGCLFSKFEVTNFEQSVAKNAAGNGVTCEGFEVQIKYRNRQPQRNNNLLKLFPVHTKFIGHDACGS